MIRISTDLNNTDNLVITVSIECMNIGNIYGKEIINGVILTPPYEAVISDNIMIYRNIYHSYLNNNKEAHEFLLLLLRSSLIGNNITLFLTNDESSLPYMQLLLEYIYNMYGIDILNSNNIVGPNIFNLYIEFYMNKFIDVNEFLTLWKQCGFLNIPDYVLLNIWDTLRPFSVNRDAASIYNYIKTIIHGDKVLTSAIREV